jgi:hypothetical protein
MLLEMREIFCNNKQFNSQGRYNNYIKPNNRAHKRHEAKPEKVERRNRPYDNNLWRRHYHIFNIDRTTRKKPAKTEDLNTINKFDLNDM